jgi:hypothetical protein
MSKHHVKLHQWWGGVLTTVEHAFEELEHAMEFVNQGHQHTAKIYNADGEVVHVANPRALSPTEVYA